MNSRNISKEEQIKSKKSECAFDNIKSDYFLQRIFDYLKRNKLLEIVKYNKKLQNKLNLNINSYKEFSLLYSSIEIEIKLDDDTYGEFINISEEEKEYFHIYFNNSKEEINRNFSDENDEIEIIKIKIDYQIKSFGELFADCDFINSISFKKFYRNDITNMSSMFYGCESLKEIDISNFITDNVTDMSCMFSNCKSIKVLNLSNFNTDKVTNMRDIFYGCSSLNELNVSNFNTNKVKDMSGMFAGCASLKELNISNFNTNNVTDMAGMFRGCASLKELELSNFITNNVTDMCCMFAGCSSLRDLNISNFIINNKTDVTKMFDECSDELKKKIKMQNKNFDDIVN